MASFLKSKLKGSSKSTPPVSNQSSFSDPVQADDEFHDASEEVSCMHTSFNSLFSPSATRKLCLRGDNPACAGCACNSS